MKHINTLILLLVCLTSFAQKESQNDIQGFNDFLGIEKAKAFNEAVSSFDDFLQINFKNETTNSGRTIEFLNQFSLELKSDSTWKFNTEENQLIIEDWENSGLRKELWIYRSEVSNMQFDRYSYLDTMSDIGENNLYDIEEEKIHISRIDSAEDERLERELEEMYRNIPMRNTRGQFFYGLDTFAPNDSFIQEYIDVCEAGNLIWPFLINDAFLSPNLDYNDPFIKRIIVFEIYYWLLIWDIENNKGK